MRDGPSLDRVWTIRTDGSRRKLHPADVRGRFIVARRWVFLFLMLIALALPIVPVGSHPAMQLDIAARRFYLFGGVFNATDAWIGLFVLGAVAFMLLFVTAWKGRVWCGWACPQTVFLEGAYRRIERLIDGSGEKRLRDDLAPMTNGKAARRVLKHTLFVLFSFVIAHSAVAYFISFPVLFADMKEGPGAHADAFIWAMVVTAFLYFNYAWFREQMCIVICPYGRLQSVLVDGGSTVVGYDKERGEPRGKAGTTKGDCVDCTRCVAVCPTGIDIRNGLQMECIACAQCIDACDEIMDKLKRPRGLVRYGSQHSFVGGDKRPSRARLWVYGLLAVAAMGGGAFATARRTNVEARLLRTRGAPWVVMDGRVRNQYELHLTNKQPVATTFQITPSLPASAEVILPMTSVTLQPLGSTRLPIFVSIPIDGSRNFELQVAVDAPGLHTVAVARFLTPSMR